MSKWVLALFLCMAWPSLAQHRDSLAPPTRPAAASFWALHPRTQTVSFGGHSHLRGETHAESAQHVRRWLTAYFTSWEEFKDSNPAKLLFSAQLRGLHDGITLRCAVGVKLEKDGFRYLLSQFTLGAPTGQGTVFWHPLHQLLADPDFRQDLDQFQQELEQALPNL